MKILDILKSVINNKKVDLYKYNKEDINELYKEVESHNITSLIYNQLDKEELKQIDKELFEEWKKKSILTNLAQVNLTHNLLSIAKEIEASGHEVIYLKGAILKAFYKQSELRTMSDLDILVKREDEEDIFKILLNKGFIKQGENHPVHCEFLLNEIYNIEIHRKLINEDVVSNDFSSFEDHLWNNLVEVEVNGFILKSLSLENLVVHLILHMAVHAKYSGFGLRQIVDLALLMKEKDNEINWNEVHLKLEACNMMKFTVGIFKLINNLFEVDIPKEFKSLNVVTQREVNSLLDLIMLSGVNGKKDVEDGFNVLVSKEATDSEVSKFKKIKMLAFPKAEHMSERYNYAKENKALLPIAWIHHAYYGVVIKKYGIKGSIASINKGLNVSDTKNKLIKIFEL